MWMGWMCALRRQVRRRCAMQASGVHCLRRPSVGSEILLTVLLGIVLAAAVIVFLGLRLRPAAAVIAKAQTENTVNRLVEEAVLADLSQRELGYSDFVTIQRDSSGNITALTTDMAAMNQLRGQLIECILGELDGVDVSEIQIPLGSLLDIDILWAKGPSLRLHSMSVGTVSAEFESEFISAGVNQTLHRIWLKVKVPLTLMLPGDRVETEVSTRLCVAETVIVGKVPDAYLNVAK